MPVIETDSTNTIDGIERWASGNVTPDSQNKLRHIVDAYARSKDREFADVTKRWDIDWFWKVDSTPSTYDPRSKQKEFYALNLVNADTEKQLWGYS